MEHRLPAGTPGEADGVPLPWGRLHFEQIAAALTADGLVAEQDRERMRFSAQARATPVKCIRWYCCPTSSWPPPAAAN
jgi:hypothetical protein